jgi:hypothetical protein
MSEVYSINRFSIGFPSLKSNKEVIMKNETKVE